MSFCLIFPFFKYKHDKRKNNVSQMKIMMLVITEFTVANLCMCVYISPSSLYANSIHKMDTQFTPSCKQSFITHAVIYDTF